MPPTLTTSSQQQFFENVHHAIQETLKKFQIHLELCMNDPPFMSGFFEFLKQEHNAASLEFVLSVDDFALGRMVRPVKSTLFSSNSTSSWSPSSSPLLPSSSSNGSSSPLRNFKMKTKPKNNNGGASSASASSSASSSSSSTSMNSTVHNSVTNINSITVNRKQKAREIISRFINDCSPHQVNLSYPVKEAIVRNFEKECLRPDNDIDPHLFDEARVEISLQLNCDSFVRFLKSRYFVQFVTEMVERDVSSHNMDLIYKYLSSYFSKIGERRESVSRKGSPPSMNSPSMLSPTSFDTSPNNINNNDNNESDDVSSQTNTEMEEFSIDS
ncbi:hypothetical protein FDP41_010968 [Naegleria fowleri]|uniref:RGS domain-containing protein n=1 Tax=Naegleria fowleri TaxID=5763 RepID=A0A6A5CBG7_NAEFO|nr:uncharacterized protein FDP41_010968 [Naegleria fowleri]KAF0982990.1 hypothetical protein FDP41_010968 [Naegleria fowleri]